MKNLLLFSTLLLTTAAAFAQLTVKPNGAADSYVYVKNQIVYVDGAIDLTKNKPGTTEASIYLRNDGQLIQGGTTSSNDGDGFLSVQQNTNPTNAFAYYYWCSPVGNPIKDDGSNGVYPMGNTPFGLSSIYEDTSGTTGIATSASKSLNVASKEGYTMPQLTISRRWMYIMDQPATEAENSYFRINATNGALPGYGFTMMGVNPGFLGAPNPDPNTYNQVYDFRGRPNNGDFVIDIAGADVPMGDPKMTLTGNPYPSALDLNKLFYDTDNSDLGAIYYYDEDRSVFSHNYSDKPYGYGVWVPNGPNGLGTYTAAPFYIWKADGTNDGGDPMNPFPHSKGNPDNYKRYAPIGQGFMFVGKDGVTAGTATIKNEYRVFVKEGTANNSVFQRPENDSNLTAAVDTGKITNKENLSITFQEIEPQDNRSSEMRLWVVFDEAITRELLLTFNDQATDSYDRGLDGRSPMGLKTDAYFPVPTQSDTDLEPYVINSVKYDANKQIPLTFVLDKQTEVNINAVDEVKKPYDNAYVFDIVENTYKKISHRVANTKPLSGASYTLPAGTYNNRFYIVFRSPNVKEDMPKGERDQKDAVLANVSFFQNNQQQQLEVQNPNGYTIKSATMYDMSGKMVIAKTNLGDSNNLNFYTGNLSDGVYLVKLITNTDVTIDYKAIVHN